MEKQRYRSKSKESRDVIKQLNRKLQVQQDKSLIELSGVSDLKKKNMDLRQTISELIQENKEIRLQNDSLNEFLKQAQSRIE
jgi:hypothetical protein